MRANETAKNNSMYSEEEPHRKLRFPVISQTMLRRALDDNLISHEDKDSLIRNPNQLTVFRIKFDVESPRTHEAMQQLHVQPSDLQVIEYREHYDASKDALENIVMYLQYLTRQYKILTELLRVRNELKHHENKASKQSTSKNIRFKEEVMLTEVPEQQHHSKESSFNHMNQSTSKKEVFDRKLLKERENYGKFLSQAMGQLNKQEEYYSKTVPEVYKKVVKNKQQHLDGIKNKLKKQNNLVNEICMKKKHEQESQYQEHESVLGNIEKDLLDHQKRREKYLQQEEPGKSKEDRQKMREQKRNIYKQDEQQMISSVMQNLKAKSDYLNDYLTQKKLQDQLRYEQNLKSFEERQNKLQEMHQAREYNKVQYLVSKSTQRQEQLNKHEKSQLSYQKSMTLKNSRLFQKIESFQEQQDRMLHESVTLKLQEGESKYNDVLKRHQSMIELRKNNINQKVQARQGTVKQKQMENMLMKMHKSDKIVQKNLEISKKKELIKQEMYELNKYKQEQMMEQVELRHNLINKYSQIL